MKHTIEFYEFHSGRWVNVSNESFWTELEARARFMQAVNSCSHCAHATKIDWNDGTITLGRFKINALK